MVCFSGFLIAAWKKDEGGVSSLRLYTVDNTSTQNSLKKNEGGLILDPQTQKTQKQFRKR